MSLGDVLSIIGNIIGIASIVLTWILFAKTFTSKALSSHIYTTASVDPPEVRISSSGELLRNIVHSDCTIWNSGRTTIYGQDVKSADGISISVTKGDIVDDPLLQISLPENKVEVLKDSQAKVSCKFDYLDPGQGFMVSIAFTGPFPPLNPTIRTVIAGMPKGITSHTEREYRIRSFYASYGSDAIILITIALFMIWFNVDLKYSIPIGVSIVITAILAAIGLHRAKEGRRPYNLTPQWDWGQPKPERITRASS